MKRKTKLLLLSFLACNAYTNAQLCFSPKADYAVGINPVSICYADFNADSVIDLAVANKSGSVSILLGNGTGGFGVASHFTTGYLAVAICATDLNGDSVPDLATSNAGPWTISMLRGNGAGGFGTDTIIGSASNPHALTTADFNGDGNADLAEATQYTIIVLLGDGAGNFTDSSFATGHSYSSITPADFNGDTIVDLAMAGGGNNVTILLGKGNGSFETAAIFPVDTSPLSTTAADFNHDGKIDLATCNRKNNVTGNVSVLFGTGTGSFGAVTNFSVGTNTVPYSLCSADFNGDSIADLAIAAIANNSTANVSVLENNGTGGFGTATVFAVDSFPHAVISADFDKDGKMDLALVTVFTNNDTGKVDVLLNCSITGVNTVAEEGKGAILYPNPTTGLFTIKISEPQEALYIVEIYNTCGEKIYASQFSWQTSNEIDLSNFMKGIYFVKINAGEKFYTQKIGIQ